MKAERIAVLGAGGFLGSHLVPGLLERFDCQIDAVDVDFSKLEQRDTRVQRITARVEEPGLVDAITGRCSVVLSLTGGRVFRLLWMPLAILVLMVPLPAFFNNSLSLQMQLWSSWLGVALIRLADST